MTDGLTQDQAFLAAIVDDPDDDSLRLIYADWLEEQGDPRGEFIRVQCELARLAEDDRRRWELADRERALLAEHEQRWVGPVRDLVSRWRFRRGFIEEVTLSAAALLEHGTEL